MRSFSVYTLTMIVGLIGWAASIMAAPTTLISDDFTSAASAMPANPSSGIGSPIASVNTTAEVNGVNHKKLAGNLSWTNYQLADRIPNRYDGAGSLVMPQTTSGVGGWCQYIDTRSITGLDIQAGTNYAYVLVSTMPTTGTAIAGFGSDPGWGQGTNRSVKFRGGKIYLTNSTMADTGTGVLQADTGATYTPGQKFSIAISIDDTLHVSVWKMDGRNTDPFGPGWVNITPAGPAALLTMPKGGNLIGVNHAPDVTRTADEVSSNLNPTNISPRHILDYISLSKDAVVPVELSDFGIE